MANRKQLLDQLLSPEGVLCPTPEETVRVAALLAEGLSVGDVISLEGPLGAGKTQFSKGIAAGLSCPDIASSPTFALVHEYTGGRLPLFHFDFYRMDAIEELLTAGYDDCLAEGVVVAEWGDKFPEALPQGTLRLRVAIQPDHSRRIMGELKP